MNDKVGFWDLGGIEGRRNDLGQAYFEFMRVATMSAGAYVLHAGAKDSQSPHRQDELYYVVHGKSRMRAGAEDRSIAPGSIIFVAAGIEHEFYAIEAELTLLVFFAPAESEA